VFEKDAECHLLFTKRTETLRHHKGQISFPGGTKELEGVTLLDTAPRECREEIGFDPDNAEILGQMDSFPTLETTAMSIYTNGILLQV